MSRISPLWYSLMAVTCLGAAAGAQVAGRQSGAPAPALPLASERMAEMQHHFLQVTAVHEALIRGDLDAVRAPARELSVLPIPVRVPASAGPFVQLIREAGRRAVSAPSLAVAAGDVGTMLTLCGDCHRTVGVSPAPSVAKRPDVGGMVGHMLEHQRALDDLLRGLIVPSTALWSSGAARLATAALSDASLVADPKLTSDIRQAEKRVHELAGQVAKATTPDDRAAAYGTLLGTCAQCHGLHGRIWGPRSTP